MYDRFTSLFIPRQRKQIERRACVRACVCPFDEFTLPLVDGTMSDEECADRSFTFTHGEKVASLVHNARVFARAPMFSFENRPTRDLWQNIRLPCRAATAAGRIKHVLFHQQA